MAGPAVAQSQPSKKGHLKRLWLRNVQDFRDDLEVRLCCDTGDFTSATVAFIGEMGSGQDILCKLIAAINIIRGNTGDMRDPDRKLVDCKEPFEFSKREPSKEGLFVVEVAAGTEESVYYGLYSPKDQGRWEWSCDQDRQCSIAFVYLPQHSKIYIFQKDSSEEQGQTVRMQEHGSPEMPDAPDAVKLLNFFCDTIEDLPRLVDYPAVEGGDQFLEQLHHLLPSIFLAGDLWNHIYEPGTHWVRVVERVLSDCESTSFGCLLLEMKNDYPRNIQRCLSSILAKCTEKHLQVILVSYSQDLLHNTNAKTLVRFWKSWDSIASAHVVPNELREGRTTCKNQSDWTSILHADMVMLVEGPSDFNVMTALLQNWDPLQEEELWLDNQYDSKAQISLDKLLSKTVCYAVGGKGNFHQVVDTLLHHAYLGLPYFIICDYDAVTGGKDEDVTEKLHWDTVDAQSQIFDSSSKSVLYKCIKHLDRSRSGPALKFVLGMYTSLCTAKCGSGDSVIERLRQKESRKQKGNPVANLCSDVIKHNCPKLSNGWDFCEDYLHTFAWKEPPLYTLESAIASSSAHTYAKSDLLKFGVAGEVCKQMKENKNKEILRFFKFFVTRVFELYKEFSAEKAWEGCTSVAQAAAAGASLAHAEGNGVVGGFHNNFKNPFYPGKH